MPPEIALSDNDSSEDIIQATKSKRPNKKIAVREKNSRATNIETEASEVESVENAKASDESGEDEKSVVEEGPSGDEEIFTVESIMNHRFGGNDNQDLFFLVKWENYPNKKDWTWEPESNLQGGSDEIIQNYFENIGGRPKTPTSNRKRSRTATTPGKSTVKKTRTSSVSVSMQDEHTPVKSAEEKSWKPPSGSWEDHVAHIDTIEKSEKGLICYIQWSNGRKSQHDLNVVRKKCPQRMLSFYEQHLVFKEYGSS